VQVVEPLLDDVPAGQTVHDLPGARNIPEVQDSCPGSDEGAAVEIVPGGDVGTIVGIAVGTTGPIIRIR
jgi:hypothetical protein